MNRHTKIWLPYSGIKNASDVINKGDFLLRDLACMLLGELRYQGALGVNCNVLAHQTTIYNQMLKNKESSVNCLYGLIHDTEEAFLRDRCSPIKHYLGETTQREKDLEHIIKSWVLVKLGINTKHFFERLDLPTVKNYDISVCALEFNSFGSSWYEYENMKKNVNKDKLFDFTIPYAKCITVTGWLFLLQDALKNLPAEVVL